MDREPAHEHNSNEFFDRLVKKAAEKNAKNENDVSRKSLNSDEQLSDRYQMEDEKERSRYISAILSHYENSYKNKVDFQHRYRIKLFWGCSGIIIAFVGMILCTFIYAIVNLNCINISGVVTVITVILSLVVSIMGLVQTITKYCFPKNDEEYIVRIVESIQSNDLEKMKNNAEYILKVIESIQDNNREKMKELHKIDEALSEEKKRDGSSETRQRKQRR